ncbi:hypothetical protein [Salinisphaera aquimarina]|uniref:Uncharacterized protein n=1 Tax=Salinisphaera aquimarina TaxID=2094031 RepID=A0ABV7ETD2_9GAMM
MNWIKAGCVGLIGSLIIFIVMFVGVNVTGAAPFNLSPSAAFLAAIDIPPKPLALLLHFGYGFAWAVVLYALFRDRVSIANGTGLALVQWLLMMIVYTPIIGWGLFGFGGSGHDLAADAPLYIGNPIKYVVLTLVLHVTYGALNGWLVPRWTRHGLPRTATR